MDVDFVSEITNQAIRVTLMISAPMLLGALFIGILVSLFQAVTQINEQTLAFIPKILVILGALAIFAPWMSDTIINFTKDIFINIPQWVTSQ
ncbi:MAG: flagellar biosynthesis protein FliQ [Pseudomonadota bacterium]